MKKPGRTCEEPRRPCEEPGPQNPCGNHGGTPTPNPSDASASAPGRSSRTRPAAPSAASDTPPSYAAPNSRTDRATSAASAVRSQDAPFMSPLSRQRPAFQGQNVSSTSNTTSTGV